MKKQAIEFLPKTRIHEVLSIYLEEQKTTTETLRAMVNPNSADYPHKEIVRLAKELSQEFTRIDAYLVEDIDAISADYAELRVDRALRLGQVLDLRGELCKAHQNGMYICWTALAEVLRRRKIIK